MTEVHVHEIETNDVVVVGGGLAGLAAAATAAREGRRTVLLDAHRLGGRAATDERAGFVFNRGPRGLYREGAGRRVLDDLGVATDRGAAPPLAGAVGQRAGRLHLIPQGPWSLLRTDLLPAREKVRFAQRFAGLARLDPGALAGTTADEVVASLGLGPVARELFTALIRLSTYAAATDLLDGPTALRQLQAGASGGVTYLDGGWQPLVDGLAAVAAREGATIRPGVPVRSVTEDDDGPLVVIADGQRLRAAQVVVAAGGPDAVESVLSGRPTGWPPVGPPALAACLELALRRPPPTRFVLGIDESLYLSVHCPPADLAPPGGAVVHATRYLRHDEDRPSAVVRDELRALARSAGIGDDDIVDERFLARMVVTGAIPTRDGLAGRPTVEVPGRPGVLLAGDWVGGEGLLADAALASGARAGRLAAERSGRLAVG